MSTAEEFLDIGTPENVVFGYEVAGIGSRFLAALVDTLLIAGLLLVANFVLIFLASATGQLEGTGSQVAGWLAAVLGLISFLILWGYYIFFELLWNGQSPGKRLIGLRVIGSNGSPLGLLGSIVRNLIRVVDFLPLYYGVGVIAMFVSHRAQRLGDLAAGTLVVYERGTVTLESLAPKPVRSSSPPESFLTQLPLERLQPADIALAESFVQRRTELVNQHELAIELASALLARMQVPPSQTMNFSAPELLRAVAAYHGAGS